LLRCRFAAPAIGWGSCGSNLALKLDPDSSLSLRGYKSGDTLSG
jgi:hypothetical protein